MTREEVQNSLEMRIVQREMVKKFPFIIDIKMTDDFEENDALYEYVYFSKITISNSKILEQYPHWQIRSWMEGRLEEDGQVDNLIYLTELYLDLDHPTPSEVQKEMDEMTSKIHWMIRKQVTIPDEFKLRKKIGISKYKVVE
jgi:hypothetical protein